MGKWREFSWKRRKSAFYLENLFSLLILSIACRSYYLELLLSYTMVRLLCYDIVVRKSFYSIQADSRLLLRGKQNIEWNIVAYLFSFIGRKVVSSVGVGRKMKLLMAIKPRFSVYPESNWWRGPDLNIYQKKVKRK